jgi:hypothetical protein
MRRIVVIAEDYDRTLLLLRELDDLGAKTVLWNVSTGALVPTLAPEDAVYFCRQSPSCGTRGHPGSIPYVRNLLWWLAHHGRTIVNGPRAFEMEMSKAAQMGLLHSRGINTPRTQLVLGTRQLWVELVNAAAHPATPVIIKPDTGGSGVGIQAFANASQAAMHIREHGSGVGGVANDPTLWIVQEHVNAFTTDESKMRSILRFEIVGGRVMYVMQIRAPATEFKLCPCDPKMEAIMSKIEFRIITDPLSIPCFRERPQAYAAFVAKLEGVWASLDARVGSAEAFMPVRYADDADERAYSPQAQLAPDEPIVFEINFNSNYNKKAEEQAGVNGARAVARMLMECATEGCAASSTPLPPITAPPFLDARDASPLTPEARDASPTPPPFLDADTCATLPLSPIKDL